VIIGVAGLALISAAWALTLSEPPPLRLSALYSAGSLLLAVHAITIPDPVFTALNLLSFLLSTINVARRLRPSNRR